MYSSFNSNYDQEGFVDVPKEISEFLGKEETQIRVHDSGYIEGDTGGAVGSEDAWHWYSDENGYYEEVTEREQHTLYPLDSKIRAVYLEGEQGKALGEAERFKKGFTYDGELWRVYRMRGVWQVSELTWQGKLNYHKFAQFGEHDNYKCFAVLVSFGSETLAEIINDEISSNSFNWKECDCQSSGYEDDYYED